MQSIKRSLAVISTVVALMALAPVASAGSHHDFHLDKTCAEDSGEPLGFICTVQHSDFKWIPPGTDIRYVDVLSDDPYVEAARIEIRNGSAEGACEYHSASTATCVFSAGAGRLTRFNLEVDVTASADLSVWSWDGRYWFGD
jgi:hypothetical protein